MKILDSSALNYLLKNNIVVEGPFYVTPDILDELQALEIEVDKTFPKKDLVNISDDPQFPYGTYLKNYHYVLNKYGSEKLYSMRGIGDVSLIALALTIVEHDVNVPLLPDMAEKPVVYLNDRKFEIRLKNEVGDKIQLLKPQALEI